MGTQNATITPTWRKIADSEDDSVLIQAIAATEFQVATMDTETTPAVEGFTVLGRSQAISRTLIGPGHIYARHTGAGPDNVLVVSGSSESLT